MYRPHALIGPEDFPGASASAAKVVKGEDATSNTIITFEDGTLAAFHAVFDGHGGAIAAQFCAKKMSQTICRAFARAQGDRRSRLAQACVASFELADADLAKRGLSEGTTATVILVSADTITCANVGDSLAFMYKEDGSRFELTSNHRLTQCLALERERVLAAGAEVGQPRDQNGNCVGPPRIFPGGLMMTRSIGDSDCTAAIIATPSVMQIPYPPNGATIVIASDGLWDFVDCDAMQRLVKTEFLSGLGVRWLAQVLLAVTEESNHHTDDASVVCVSLASRGEMHALLLAEQLAAATDNEASQPARLGRLSRMSNQSQRRARPTRLAPVDDSEPKEGYTTSSPEGSWTAAETQTLARPQAPDGAQKSLSRFFAQGLHQLGSRFSPQSAHDAKDERKSSPDGKRAQLQPIKRKPLKSAPPDVAAAPHAEPHQLIRSRAFATGSSSETED